MAYEPLPNYPVYPSTPPPSGKTPTLQLWQKVLFAPGVNTLARYRGEAELGRAVWWLVLSSGIAIIVNLLATVTLRRGMDMLRYLPPEMRRELLPFMGPTRAPIGATLACGIPTAIVSTLIGTFIGIGIVYLVAKLLQGEGNFTQTFFLMMAVSAPLTLIIAALQGVSALANFIPLLGAIFSIIAGLVTFALSIYNLVLSAMAVAAAHRFSLGKGFAALLLPMVVAFLFACCAVVFIIAAAGVSLDQLLRQLGSILLWSI